MRAKKTILIWLLGLTTSTVLASNNIPVVKGFINTDIRQHTAFYVGGHYYNGPGKSLMYGQIYVEGWAPEKITKSYPIVLIHGFSQTAMNWMITPDGRRGWADFFVSQGYVVYMIDQPVRGRSPWQPEANDDFESMDAQQVEERFTAPELYQKWPQAKMHTQWPGMSKAGGQIGDEYFDAFYAGTVPSLRSSIKTQELMREAGGALLDKIGPAVLLTHSQSGLFGWSIANARPNLVKAIVSVEPSGPPFVGATRSKSKLDWGITDIPLDYSPIVSNPTELKVTQQSAPDRPDLVKCWMQVSPAKRLVKLEKTPVLILTGEASYHAPYDHCTAKFLSQAGVRTEHWRLEGFGIKGNGHMIMLEKNNMEVAGVINKWIMEKLN